jgi:hypothetical protein
MLRVLVSLQSSRQGDQIGRIFAYWAILYLCTLSILFSIAEAAQVFGLLYINEKIVDQL